MLVLRRTYLCFSTVFQNFHVMFLRCHSWSLRLYLHVMYDSLGTKFMILFDFWTFDLFWTFDSMIWFSLILFDFLIFEKWFLNQAGVDFDVHNCCFFQTLYLRWQRIATEKAMIQKSTKHFATVYFLQEKTSRKIGYLPLST